MEKEEEEPDFSSLNKYFKDDDSTKTEEIKVVKTIIEDVSISSFESYDRNENREDDYREEESSNPKKISPEKKEFLKSMEDDGLNLDTCANVNRDWNR